MKRMYALSFRLRLVFLVCLLSCVAIVNAQTPIQGTVTVHNATDPCSTDGSLEVNYLSGGAGSSFLVIINGSSHGPYPIASFPVTISNFAPGVNYTVYIDDAFDPFNSNHDRFDNGPVLMGSTSPSCSGGIVAALVTEVDASTDCSTDGFLEISANGGSGFYQADVFYNGDYLTTVFNGESDNYLYVNGAAGSYHFDVYNAGGSSSDANATTYDGTIGYGTSCNPAIVGSVTVHNATDPCSTDGSLEIGYISGGINSSLLVLVNGISRGTFLKTAFPVTISNLTPGVNYTVQLDDAFDQFNSNHDRFDNGPVLMGSTSPSCSGGIVAALVTEVDASTDCSTDGFLEISANGGSGFYQADVFYNGDYLTTVFNGESDNYLYVNGAAGSYHFDVYNAGGSSSDANATTYDGSIGYGTSCNPAIVGSVTVHNATDPCSTDGSLEIGYISGGINSSLLVLVNGISRGTFLKTAFPVTISNLTPGVNYTVQLDDAFDQFNSNHDRFDNGPVLMGSTSPSCSGGIVAALVTEVDASTDCSTDGFLEISANGGSGFYQADVFYNGDYLTTVFNGESDNYLYVNGAAGSYHFDVYNAGGSSSDANATTYDGSIGYGTSCNPAIVGSVTVHNATDPCSTDGSLEIGYISGGINSSLLVLVNGISRGTFLKTAFPVTISNLTPGVNYTVQLDDAFDQFNSNHDRFDNGPVLMGSTSPSCSGGIVAALVTEVDASTDCSTDGFLEISANGGSGFYQADVFYNGDYLTTVFNGESDNYLYVNGAAGSYHFDVYNAGGSSSDANATTYDGTIGSFAPCPTNDWLGLSTDWTDGNNWSTGIAPSSCSDNVTISNVGSAPAISGNVSVGNVTVNGNVTFNVGGNLSVCGNWKVASGSSVVVGAGTVVLSGSSSQTISGTSTFQTIVVNNGSGAKLASGANVSVYNMVKLTFGNLTIPADAHLTFKSTSTSQAAILDDFTSGNGSRVIGNITAERFYGNAILFGQHMLGSPVSGITMASLGSNTQTGGYIIPTNDCNELISASNTPYGNVFSNHEANGSACTMACWYVEPAANTPVAGQGYSVLLTHPNSALSVTGTPNEDESYTINNLNNSNWSNISLQGRPYNSGWALLSNPYLSALNADDLIADNALNFDEGIMVWNQTTGNYQFATTIPPFQAFMVHRSVQGDASYVINGSARVIAAADDFQRNSNPNELKLVATNISTGLTDETMVGFNPDATTAFDPKYDFGKIPGSLSRHTLYSINNGKWMIRNILPSVEETPSVTVGFEPGVSGTYTLDFSGINSFDATSYITLEDTKTGNMHDVRTGVYTFSADKDDNWTRFILHFTPAVAINTTDATCTSAGQINITQPGTSNWNYNLNNATGILVSTGVVNANNNITETVPAGNYQLTLTDANNYTVVRSIEIAGAVPVTAAITPSATTAEVSQEIALASASVAAEYNWNFGDGTTATGASANHSYTTEGIYNIALTAISSTGCSSTTSQVVTITPRSVTGINNLVNGRIAIWSNGNQVYIDFAKMNAVNANIEMYDVLGQKLLNDKSTTSSLYIKTIANMETGYVIVQVKNNDQITTQKVFITNTR